AEQYGIHPQTLRLYEREGLIVPARSAGNTRLYDQLAIERLEAILTLTRDLGVNLAGVEVILNLRDQLAALESEMARVAGDLRRELRSRPPEIDRARALVPAAPRALVRR
ncbi:MAG: MerR family transcriptional regulator, partial [Thermoanaerobaculia bacterium]